MDYGLLGGLGEGMQKGLLMYMQAKKQRRDQEVQNLTSGIQDDGNGNLSLTPQMQAQRDAASKKADFELQNYDPNSDLSQHKSAGVKGLLNATKAGLGDTLPEHMSGAELDQLKDYAKPEISGYYGMLGAQARGNAILGAANMRVDEQRNQNAAAAGKDFEHDKIIGQTKNTLNNISRALEMINGRTPITAASFNILQQDLINATAPGGAATEGKVNREMVNTLAGKLNELKSRFGKVSDLRADQPEIVQNLKSLLTDMRGEYGKAQSNQAQSIANNYVANTNPRVRQTVDEKVKQYVQPETPQNMGLIGQPQAGTPAHPPGTIVIVKGKGRYQVGADGDSLTEVK